MIDDIPVPMTFAQELELVTNAAIALGDAIASGVSYGEPRELLAERTAKLLRRRERERINEEEVLAWQEVTFPNATPVSAIKHLREELWELMDAQRMYDPSDYEDAGCFKIYDEIGDCALLLTCVAGMNGVTLAECANNKFEKAKQRRYEFDPKLGYARHIEETGAGDEPTASA